MEFSIRPRNRDALLFLGAGETADAEIETLMKGAPVARLFIPTSPLYLHVPAAMSIAGYLMFSSTICGIPRGIRQIGRVCCHSHNYQRYPYAFDGHHRARSEFFKLRLIAAL